MELKREALLDQMDLVPVYEGEIDALAELAYTAFETGIIDFAIKGSDEELESILRLIKLADRYKTGVPDELRM